MPIKGLADLIPDVSSGTATIDPNKILATVLQKYPRLANVNDPSNTQAIFSSPERTKLAGDRQLEYWPAQEPGTPDFPNPSPGKITLEIYNNELRQNPQLLENAIYGDLLHGLRNDKTFDLLRHEFKSGFMPETIDFEKRNGFDEMDDSRLDAYIRGALAPDKNNEFMLNQEKSGNVYSDKQMRILEIMKKYLGSKE